MTPTEQDKELREKLAAIEHQRWSDWQKWVHKVLREANPSPEIGDILERWDRQIETPYEKLSDKEKASDMEQVDRYWQLITADRKRVALEARINEHQLLQHQGMNVLTKTPKSILGWSELRVEQLKKG